MTNRLPCDTTGAAPMPMPGSDGGKTAPAARAQAARYLIVAMLLGAAGIRHRNSQCAGPGSHAVSRRAAHHNRPLGRRKLGHQVADFVLQHLRLAPANAR
jgi:hypothetical protein